MRLPVPTNRLVSLALVGALLTGVVAVGLALPAFGGSDGGGGAPAGNALAAADTPTPNANFTPAVATQQRRGYEGGEHEEHEDDEREEHDGGEHEDGEHEYEG